MKGYLDEYICKALYFLSSTVSILYNFCDIQCISIIYTKLVIWMLRIYLLILNLYFTWDYLELSFYVLLRKLMVEKQSNDLFHLSIIWRKFHIQLDSFEQKPSIFSFREHWIKQLFSFSLNEAKNLEISMLKYWLKLDVKKFICWVILN